MSKNLSELSGRKGLKENLFEEIGRSAHSPNIDPIEKMETLADRFLVGKANVYGAASFYDFLQPENKNKKIYTCNGTACMTAGTQSSLKEKLLEHFSAEEIGEMCCLGRCHENSAFHYKGHNYSGDAVNQITTITKNNTTIKDDYRVSGYGTAILTEKFPGTEYYYSSFRKVFQKSADDLLSELKLSGLRGRGGAGFPIAVKLEGCRKEQSDQKFIVCNADEGDPGAYSDRYLLEQQPHRLLLGMMIAGYIAGADTGIIYIRGEYPESINTINESITEFKKHAPLNDFHFEFKVIAAQGAYICGEETALLSSIEGQRPEVRVRPPYPVQQGLFNKPTVVNNVETLACIPYIIQNGGEKFASVGKGRSTGTKLISLDGHFNKPGICEVDMGTKLSVVINELGGGFRSNIKTLHIGGPLGGLVPVHKINDLSVDFESFSENGFLLGHASVVCIPADFPMIKYLEHLFRFTAHESCGKCFPCRIGSVRGYELLEKAQGSGYKIDRTLFEDLINTLEIGSLCALGGGLPLPVKNALQYFNDELKEYFTTS